MPRVGLGGQLELLERVLELLAGVVEAVLGEVEGEILLHLLERLSLLGGEPGEALGSANVDEPLVEILWGVRRQPRGRQPLEDLEQRLVELVPIVELPARHHERRVAREVDGPVRLGEVGVARGPRLGAHRQQAALEHHELPVRHRERPGSRVHHRQRVEGTVRSTRLRKARHSRVPKETPLESIGLQRSTPGDRVHFPVECLGFSR